MTRDELDVLNSRLLAYLRSAAEKSPRMQRVGRFVATFDADPLIYLNYAVPDAGIDPSPDDIAALVEMFEKQGRKPRLEYIPGAAPALEARLLAAGFAVEQRLPVMLRTATMSVADPSPEGLETFLPADDADLIATDRAQAEAFGSAPRGLDGLERTLSSGGIVAAVRDTASGAIVAGGVATPPIEGISEIAGIGTIAAFRQRGAASAITALLAREALARGTSLLWLTPGSKDAERIYARAGFEAVTAALHISK